jgi:cell wall-associated NlpC family hydrolase
MQEKVSAITPAQTMDKKTLSKQHIANQNKISPIAKTDTIQNNPNNKIMLDSTILEELALSIQSSMDMDMDFTKKEEVAIESISIEENWVEFTKEDEILETAKEYLGVQYIWAANGPSAFDCSGYTKYVFKKNGITLPRYSGHQANVGMTIRFDELQKGDLVFFDTAKGFHGKVNHVGIYIGENKFIHASSARKKVMITSFSQKKFYKNRFLHGQRIVNSDASFASNRSNKSIHTN